MIGLQRSVAFSGARSELLTLWPIDDTKTKELMVAFYRNLLDSDRAGSSSSAIDATEDPPEDFCGLASHWVLRPVSDLQPELEPPRTEKVDGLVKVVIGFGCRTLPSPSLVAGKVGNPTRRSRTTPRSMVNPSPSK